MRTLILLFLALSFNATQAQNNLIVFSEDGVPFTLRINGEQINDEPATRVKAEGLRNPAISCVIDFDGNVAPTLKKNMSFLEKGTEITARIVMTKKGYRLKYFGEVIIDDAEDIEEEYFPEAVMEEPEPPSVRETVVVETREIEPEAQTVTETVTTTVVTETEEVPNGERVNMSIDMMGVKMDVDVSVDDMDMTMDTEVSETTTTTTTTTTTMTTSEVATQEVEVEVVEEGPCAPVLEDVGRFKAAMRAESFEDDRMNVAKQALRDACLRVEGVKELAMTFNFEDDRLEFVKYCYDRAYDPQNYFELNSIFTFSDSKEELNRFLESR